MPFFSRCLNSPVKISTQALGRQSLWVNWSSTFKQSCTRGQTQIIFFACVFAAHAKTTGRVLSPAMSWKTAILSFFSIFAIVAISVSFSTNEIWLACCSAVCSCFNRCKYPSIPAIKSLLGSVAMVSRLSRVLVAMACSRVSADKPATRLCANITAVRTMLFSAFLSQSCLNSGRVSDDWR